VKDGGSGGRGAGAGDLHRAGWLGLGLVLCLSACQGCNGGEAHGSGPSPADTTLARLLAEIQPVVERSSGIQAVRPLNVAPTDEARLREYIATQLETQLSRAEAAAITAVYARLGLVPDTLDLGALLAALLEEQVIGYYDPVSDTLFVHDRVPTAELEPVLAHELVHALQDHLVDLDSIGRALEGSNDAVTAWQAVVEGHATFAMMEWQFSAMMGGEADLTELDDLGDMLSGIDLTALGDFGSTAVLAAAPAVIREGLIFPYVGGLVFLQRAWKERPSRPLPFGADRPLSTEQVLHVDRWLARDEPTGIRFAEPPPAGWETMYEKDFGELETRIFLTEHLDDAERAETAAAGWDGDAYRLVRGSGGEVLVWVSVWDSENDVAEFMTAARDAYSARYPAAERIVSIVGTDVGGRTVVRIVDAASGTEVPEALRSVELLGG